VVCSSLDDKYYASIKMTDGIRPTCTKTAVLNMPVKIFVVQAPMLDQTFIEYLFLPFTFDKKKFCH